MAKILTMGWNCYQIIFEEIADPRTKDWLLVAKPYQILTLLGLYLTFVFKWGPNLMKNRQPYNLDKILIVYNAFQVVACAYLFVKSLYLAWGWDYKWICQPVDYSNSPKAIEIAGTVYLYYALKLIDLLDTIFFVLRKKFNQVSFLHIYHHTGMCLLIWGAVTYLPGGHGTLIGVINAFVHVVMYMYYLLTVAIPSIKNEIWLKKFVTQLQIVQFFWCVVHMAIIVFKTDCEFPRWTSALFLPQNLFMLILFVDFYIKTYIKKPREELKAQMLANASKVITHDNDKRSNGTNGVAKTNGENGINNYNYTNGNAKEMNGGKNYVKNDLSKHVNGISDANNNNEYVENLNIANGKQSNCESAKCKMNGHKYYKND